MSYEYPYRKTTVVRTENDLPDPVGGVITLEYEHTYIGDQQTVILNNKLVVPANCRIKELSILSPFQIEIDNTAGITNSLTEFSALAFTYLGVGDAIYSADLKGLIVRFKEMNVVCPNLGNSFNISSSDPSSIVILDNVACILATKLGTFSGILANIKEVQTVYFVDGFTFNNCFAGVSIGALQQSLGLNVPGCKFMEFKGITPQIGVINALAQPQSNEAVFNFDPALFFAGASVIGCPIDLISNPGVSLNNVYYPGSLNKTEPGITFYANPTIPNSDVTAEFFLEGNLLTTSNPLAGARIIINATTWTSSTLERVTGDNVGCATYIGINETQITIDGNFEIEPALGQNKKLSIRYVQIEYAETSCTFTNATNKVNSVGHGLSNGDTISFYKTAGTLPAELRKDIIYYIVNAGTDDFEVSYTSGGATVAFTDDGSGSNSYSLAILLGSGGRGTMDDASPMDVIPQALATVHYGDKIVPTARNVTDTAGIDVRTGYYRVKT